MDVRIRSIPRGQPLAGLEWRWVNAATLFRVWDFTIHRHRLYLPRGGRQIAAPTSTYYVFYIFLTQNNARNVESAVIRNKCIIGVVLRTPSCLSQRESQGRLFDSTRKDGTVTNKSQTRHPFCHSDRSASGVEESTAWVTKPTQDKIYYLSGFLDSVSLPALLSTRTVPLRSSMTKPTLL